MTTEPKAEGGVAVANPPRDPRLTYYNLLPCPFCGGQPRLDESRITRGFSVHCPNCDASGGWTEGNSSQQTIDAWNRRADPSPSAVEALARAANRHLLASDKLFNAMSGEPTERALESAVDADAALREILSHPEIAALLKGEKK